MKRSQFWTSKFSKKKKIPEIGWQNIHRKEKCIKLDDKTFKERKKWQRRAMDLSKNKEFLGYLSKNGWSVDLLKIEDLQENRDGGSDIILNFMWFQKLC